MNKSSWTIILASLFALTLLIVFSMPVSSASGTVYAAATSTRWPTVTRRPTNTRWPVAPTSTRWPTVTLRLTSTLWPTITPRPTDTRWPVAPTNTRWPTVAPSLTSTRWPTPTRTPAFSPTPIPPISASWLHYANSVYGFEFYYPPDASITAQDDNHVQMYFTVTPGTNLVTKYLELYLSDASGGCPIHNIGTPAGYEIINGYRFQLGTGGDAGAGQIHEWTTYTTQQGNACISFTFILHSGNIGAFPTGIPQFDKTAESALFPQILNTFHLLSPTPAPSATPTSSGLSAGPFGVVMVKSNDVLNIRSGAGTGNAIVGSFPYNATNVMRSGSTQSSGGATWYQVQNPGGGTGWVNSYYLSEYVAPGTFCSDARIQSLFVQLQQAVNASNGGLFAALVSPVHGVDVRNWHSGKVVNYSSVQAASVFTSTVQQNWGSGPSGTDTIGTFASIVQPQLQDVLNNAYESYCNNPKAASMYSEPWPVEYTNFNYYSLYKPGTPGVDLDYSQWMIGIDFVGSKPYIVSLTHIVWEP